jgi:hypothetical protein
MTGDALENDDEIISFLHRETKAQAVFVALKYRDSQGNSQTLFISPAHLLATPNGDFVPASSIKLSDRLVGSDGAEVSTFCVRPYFFVDGC